jgi:lipopolysaccharide/colanic/teichoic acid biosynthesis glycosyltransferase
MIKFRWTVADAEERRRASAQQRAGRRLFKITDDPRITRVGGFGRRNALGERPRLLNVLRGELSFVGQRLLVPDEDAMIEGWRRRLLVVKPGMTGL